MEGDVGHFLLVQSYYHQWSFNGFAISQNEKGVNLHIIFISQPPWLHQTTVVLRTLLKIASHNFVINHFRNHPLRESNDVHDNRSSVVTR